MERRRWQTRQVESLQNWKEVNVGSSHFYFHAIFISAYSAVRVKIYAYVNMLGRNKLTTHYVFAGKESNRCKPVIMRKRMAALVKGYPAR